jgi:uncharacterized membrane protein YhaH (DUF805 family)
MKRTLKELALKFIDAVTICLMDKYFKFSGRAQLSEYWWFTLFTFIIFFLAVILDVLPNQTKATILFSAAIKLLLFIPIIAVTVRRLHDTDKSGWYYLIVLIPFVGIFILMYFCTLKGTEGPNRFGPDPLKPEPIPNSE